ncbi:ATP-grasp domain-containing protein [Ilumatobacter sp.]|uniref:ATP-grasp domain-containing protein n=1 Tax=Ilumatobacter sp. TaxID=1967498 RepID=UPI003AF6FC90
MVKVVFVAPYAMEATNRFLAAFLATDGADVAVVSNEPLERFPPSLRDRFAGHWRVGDCLDPDQLAHGAGSVGASLGGVDVLTGILEPLQVPLARARERLGIPGMDAATAENFRDKARMKAVFDAASIPCARHARVDGADAARSVHDRWQAPVVVKPLAGMGARSTFRLDDAAAIERWLGDSPPTEDAPVLMEEFLTGREFSFESVLVGGELVWHSIGRYDPTPLTVVENPWIQWSVVLPRRIDGDEFAAIRTVGTDAVRALGMSTGLSHLEWFRRPDGSVAISEVGARPPGAQIATLMSWAHDTDMYLAWARLVTHGVFDPPERKYAVGAAYLRAQGSGRSITSVTGIDRVSERTHRMVVESQLPTPGAGRSDSYEGDGYVIVRGHDSDEIDAALQEIVSVIRVECS